MMPTVIRMKTENANARNIWMAPTTVANGSAPNLRIGRAKRAHLMQATKRSRHCATVLGATICLTISRHPIAARKNGRRCDSMCAAVLLASRACNGPDEPSPQQATPRQRALCTARPRVPGTAARAAPAQAGPASGAWRYFVRQYAGAGLEQHVPPRPEDHPALHASERSTNAGHHRRQSRDDESCAEPVASPTPDHPHSRSTRQSNRPANTGQQPVPGHVSWPLAHAGVHENYPQGQGRMPAGRRRPRRPCAW